MGEEGSETGRGVGSFFDLEGRKGAQPAVLYSGEGKKRPRDRGVFFQLSRRRGGET